MINKNEEKWFIIAGLTANKSGDGNEHNTFSELQLARKQACAGYTRWSGDVIWRNGKKNFNAVSHNRARS